MKLDNNYYYVSLRSNWPWIVNEAQTNSVLCLSVVVVIEMPFNGNLICQSVSNVTLIADAYYVTINVQYTNYNCCY